MPPAVGALEDGGDRLPAGAWVAVLPADGQGTETGDAQPAVPDLHAGDGDLGIVAPALGEALHWSKKVSDLPVFR